MPISSRRASMGPIGPRFRHAPCRPICSEAARRRPACLGPSRKNQLASPASRLVPGDVPGGPVVGALEDRGRHGFQRRNDTSEAPADEAPSSPDTDPTPDLLTHVVNDEHWRQQPSSTEELGRRLASDGRPARTVRGPVDVESEDLLGWSRKWSSVSRQSRPDASAGRSMRRRHHRTRPLCEDRRATHPVIVDPGRSPLVDTRSR